ncbi:MAG: dehydrogenase [Chloroflexi bacterium]|nr:dehydrogenase [Chloroflexota bacterium]MDA8219303.1 NAD(P)-dependent oxidoreductase [Dehalococcoidales bacterium]
MRTFRVAYTGDFLNVEGGSAYGDIGLGLLERVPYVAYHFLRDMAPSRDDPTYWDRQWSLEVTPEHIADTAGLVVLRPWIKREAFSRGADNLVVIGRSGAGYDKIDVEACTDNDVAVFNAPFALNHSTASTALMFMLVLAKRLPQQERITREGRWDLHANFLGTELVERTLGIVGLGRSGRELVRLVAPFAMRVIAYSPHADQAQAEALGVRLTSLEEVLQESDFVSIHSHLTAEKRRMIGASHLALMKPTAYFVNIARGEIVDQPALSAALRERRIAGAALDVFESEPLSPDDPLTKLDNVVLTPHMACSTYDVFRATGQAMTSGILRAACGEVPDNVINREVLRRPSFQAKLARFAENRVPDR